jgi:hypothetical protein
MSLLMKFTALKSTVIFVSIFLFIGCAAQAQPTKEAANMKCGNSAIDKSYAMIHFILDDIKDHYPNIGGGGITEIKQTKTNVFLISIAQEERIDQISYALSVDDECKVALLKKEESTINFP